MACNGSAKKSDEGRTFEEPPPPVLLNSEGLDKLVRVSHLTNLAKKLSEDFNQPSYLLDMKRIRDLNLDVRLDELPLFKNILRKHNAGVLQEQWDKNRVGEGEEDESPPTPGSPTLPDYLLPNTDPVNVGVEEVQPTTSAPCSSPVNTDATKIVDEPSSDSASEDETSPVIKTKKPKRAFLSQEQQKLKGSSDF